MSGFALMRTWSDEAQQRYDQALMLLRADPCNLEYTHKVLELGRDLARLERKDNRKTVFGETRILNDIRAAQDRGFVHWEWTSESEF